MLTMLDKDKNYDHFLSHLVSSCQRTNGSFVFDEQIRKSFNSELNPQVKKSLLQTILSECYGLQCRKEAIEPDSKPQTIYEFYFQLYHDLENSVGNLRIPKTDINKIEVTDLSDLEKIATNYRNFKLKIINIVEFCDEISYFSLIKQIFSEIKKLPDQKVLLAFSYPYNKINHLECLVPALISNDQIKIPSNFCGYNCDSYDDKKEIIFTQILARSINLKITDMHLSFKKLSTNNMTHKVVSNYLNFMESLEFQNTTDPENDSHLSSSITPSSSTNYRKFSKLLNLSKSQFN